MRTKNKVIATLAIAASLCLAAPTIATAAPTVASATAVTAVSAPSIKVVPMACGYRTEYRWNDFRCWQVLTGSAPSWCWYRVYSCN
jgi:hypothetical protein